jgi:hypothetical protein
MIALRAQRIRRLVQAYSASAAIALGAMNAVPSTDERQTRIAIDRLHQASLDGFDPREVVARRIVLTLPWDETDAASDGSWFSPN